MMIRFNIAAVAAIAGLVTMSATAAADQPGPAAAVWHPWFEIGGYHNSRDKDSTGTSGSSRGETTIFTPITGGDRSLVFEQLTAKFFEDEGEEGNLALGFRRMSASGFNFGVWIGGDVRKTDIDNTFWQLSGGFEALSDNVDVRLNWYGPITDPQTANSDFADVEMTGDRIFMVGGREVGMQGVDGEIGFRVPSERLGIDPNEFEMRIYGGGYYFDHDDADEEIAGGKGRVEVRVNDFLPGLPGSRLTTEYEISHDDVRNTRHDFGARVRLPLTLTGDEEQRLAQMRPQERRMLDGIERDTDIVSTRSKAESVEDALTGTAFDRVAYSGEGDSITATSAEAGDNSLLVANGEITGQQELHGNQTLVGGGGVIAVRGRTSGVVVDVTAPGAKARLTSPVDDDNNLSLLSSNTHVSGLTIVGSGAGMGDGIDLDSDKSNMFITHVSIHDVGGAGIDGDDRNQLTVTDSLITGADGSGMLLDDGNDLTVTRVTISDVGSDGIRLFDNNTARIEDVTIRDANHGLHFGSGNSVVVTNPTIEDTREDGFHANEGNASISIIGGRIARAGGDGIQLAANQTRLFIDGLEIRDPGSHGIHINDGSFAEIRNAAISG
ncbi:MAG: right-handed parallel beta-helix repeat-containing protein, partial [Hyphomicrobiaceae bacterium]